MGHQILEQPDGRLAVFSTVTDSFLLVDGTEEEIIEWYAEEAADQARRRARRSIDQALGRSGQPPLRTALAWERAVELDRQTTEEEKG